MLDDKCFSSWFSFHLFELVQIAVRGMSLKVTCALSALSAKFNTIMDLDLLSAPKL